MGRPCFHKSSRIKVASEGKGYPEVLGLTDLWGGWYFYGGGAGGNKMSVYICRL